MNDVMPTAPASGALDGSPSTATRSFDDASVRSAVLFDMMDTLASVAVGHAPDNASVLAVAEGFRHTETAGVVRDGMRDLLALRDAAVAFAKREQAPVGLYAAIAGSSAPPRVKANGVVCFGPRAFRTKRAATWVALHTVVHPGRALVEALYARLRASTLTKLSLPVIYELVAGCLDEERVARAVAEARRGVEALQLEP